MVDGVKPHQGGPVVGGVPAVLIDGKPVAAVGDACLCKSPVPDMILTGAPRVLVAGRPIATTASTTAHGAKFTKGHPKVIIE
jgi:uncharacterized Zn-binding protein involved in type VI secretion